MKCYSYIKCHIPRTKTQFKMTSSGVLSLALVISAIAFHLVLVNGAFSDDMYIYWGSHNSWMQTDDCQLVLDQSSGSGVQSKGTFLFGSIEMLIKLVPGHSAGTVTAYYLSSTGDKHDEIDFEFLGNVSGQPYTIHTNIFAQGVGGKEQQFRPWFDPTADYHNYTIHWNPSAVVWYVNGMPIRVFRNYESQGIAYPNAQPMGVYSSLWNADEWATRGGLDKINWNSSPFVARYRNFRSRACFWNGPGSISRCAAPTPDNWYTSPQYSQLSYDKQGQMDWVRNNYMIYDYCKDAKRFNGQFPSECFKPQY